MSTLRVLARRQGVHHDPTTDEQPGASSTSCARHRSTRSPPSCRRCTTARSTRRNCGCSCWRSRGAGVRRRARSRRCCRRWSAPLSGCSTDADADGDGLCEYRSGSGHGLSNQGWKDSGDSVGWQHGPPAEGPIALCEVQAYTYEAALGRPNCSSGSAGGGGDRWRAFGAPPARGVPRRLLGGRRRRAYLAIGLDGDKRAITGRSSNPGHALGTGLLDAGDEREVAEAWSPRWRRRPGCARCRPTADGSTRSATTTVRCGRTTRRSAPGGWCSPG